MILTVVVEPCAAAAMANAKTTVVMEIFMVEVF